MAEAAIFTCSICGEPSHEICMYCTKDACGNHHCERCKRCSDCCECEMPLSAAEAPATFEAGQPPAAEAQAPALPATEDESPLEASERPLETNDDIEPEPTLPENPII